MVTLNSLDSIIDDILLTLRNNNISESESINRLQIEQWILQYRAVLIKQDIDKGRDINPSYIQELPKITLNIVNYKENEQSLEREKILVSSTSIPDTIDFHYKNGIVSIQDVFGNEIQLVSERRSNLQKHRKHSFYAYTAFLSNKYLYINGPGDIDGVYIKGVSENPVEVPGFDYTGKFPMPINMIPVLKDIIFTKEFKIQLPSDNKNNGANDLENIATKN